MDRIDLEMAVDGVPYFVKATPFQLNGNKQYQVAINEAKEVTFVFDPELGRYAPVGDSALSVPDNLEIEIGTKLNNDSLRSAGPR